MNWLVFCYSLPSKTQSSPRVTLWRRLRRFGAIAIKTGVYVLPRQGECIEAFQWLAQEVQQAQGEALVLHVEHFERLTDEELIELFREARQAEYVEIYQKAVELAQISAESGSQQITEQLAKLQKRYSEVLRIDFFDCPYAEEVAVKLRQIEQSLRRPGSKPLAELQVAHYQDKCWVTRPRPFIDRLACVWLIRRFINPQAVIRYSLQPQPHEVAFDIQGAELGHQGNWCSFETMLFKFGLVGAELQSIAEIVHELDLRDGIYHPPEAIGVEAVLRGWLLARLSDQELEARGIELFEALYLTFKQRQKPLKPSK